jgi:hypothetical protein
VLVEMKQALFIAIGAIAGATLLTLFFLPACIGIVASDYCMPLSSAFVSLLTRLGSEGGAPGVFQSAWLGYFTVLVIVLTGGALIRRARPRR